MLILRRRQAPPFRAKLKRRLSINHERLGHIQNRLRPSGRRVEGLIRDLGEFKLIERFRGRIKNSPSVVIGSGDDCAVLKFDKKSFQLFTCDMIVEGVDFSADTDPCLIGRKAIAISLSDIAACGGSPTHCLVSIGLPKNTALKKVDRIFHGMQDLCRQYNINIVGGDLSASGKLVIDVSMLGLVEKNHLALRSNAKAGDLIFVTGELGGSISGKHLKFTPRLMESRFLVRNFKVGAMIDISDGLLQDLGHILSSSRVGALVYEGLIPLSKKSKGLGEALRSGEEFELLFTLSRCEAKRMLKRNLVNFKLIGEITRRSCGFKLIENCGRVKVVDLSGKGACGFRHF